MTTTTLSNLHLAAQLLGFVATAIWLPIRMPKRGLAFLLYSLLVFLWWAGYTLAATWLNYATGASVPGFGYIAMGFLFWVIGSIVYALRCQRRGSRRKAQAEQRS